VTCALHRAELLTTSKDSGDARSHYTVERNITPTPVLGIARLCDDAILGSQEHAAWMNYWQTTSQTALPAFLAN